MKTKEQIANDWYEKGKFMSDFPKCKYSFLAGYEIAKKVYEPKWIAVQDRLPENDISVLIKVKDCRRPKENVTEISLGYYDGNWKYDATDTLVDSGHGWFIEEYMEIPQ